MESPFIYDPNTKVDPQDLIVLNFCTDAKDGKRAEYIINAWFSSSNKYEDYFKFLNSRFVIDIDLDKFEFFYSSDYISVTLMCRVVRGRFMVERDLGKFIIRNNIIEKFIYIGDYLDHGV